MNRPPLILSLTVRNMSLMKAPIVAALCAASFLQGGHASGEGSSPSPTSTSPWEKSRNIADFNILLKHSPFSLPTTEERSPLADRYALTGIVSIGEEEQIFVFDRTDQSREHLTHTPNQKQMSLVSLVREGKAALQKATIRVGSETGTISYLEAAPQPAAAPAAPTTALGRALRLPPIPQQPQPAVVTSPSQQAVIPPPAPRSFRHPMVTPPQAQ